MRLLPKPLSKRSAYVMAVLVTFAALGLRLLLRHPIGDLVPFMGFFVSVVMVSWSGGAGPGLLAMVLGLILGQLFREQPYGRLHMNSLADIWRPATFALVSTWFALVSESLRRSVRILRSGEQHLESIFETSAAGICEAELADGVWRILKVNPAFCEMTGYTRAELLTMTLRELTHPDDASGDPNVVEKAEPGTVNLHQREKRYIRKDGKTLWARLTLGILHSAEKPRGIGMITDISDWKIMEQKLRESEARYRLLAEAFSAMNWVMSPDGKLTSVSHRWEDYHGIGLEACHSNGLRTVIHPLDHLYMEGVMSSFAERGEAFELECRMRRADEAWRWCHSRLVPSKNEQGKVLHWIGNTTDVHDKREAAERLRQSEARFRGLSDASPLGVFQANAYGVVTYANARLAEIWGMSQSQYLGMGWLDRVHAEDRDDLLAGIRRADDEKRPHQVEYRLRFPSGETRWVSSSTAVIRDASGGHGGVAGTIEDITSRKHAEDELKRRGQLIRRIGEISPAVVYVYDLNTLEPIYMSPNVLGVLGYRVEDIVAHGGNAISAFMHPEDYARMPAHFQAIRELPDGMQRTLEVRLRHADGTWRYFLARSTVFKRELDGTPSQVIGCGLEISERKVAEASLRQNEQRLQMIADHLPCFIAYIDRGECYRFVNAAYRTAFGREPAEIMGRSVLELLGPELYQVAKPHILKVLGGEQTSYEHHFEFPKITGFYRVSYVPDRSESGEVLGFYILAVEGTGATEPAP